MSTLTLTYFNSHLFDVPQIMGACLYSFFAYFTPFLAKSWPFIGSVWRGQICAGLRQIDFSTRSRKIWPRWLATAARFFSPPARSRKIGRRWPANAARFFSPPDRLFRHFPSIVRPPPKKHRRFSRRDRRRQRWRGGADPLAQQPPPRSPRGVPAGKGRQLWRPPHPPPLGRCQRSAPRGPAAGTRVVPPRRAPGGDAGKGCVGAHPARVDARLRLDAPRRGGNERAAAATDVAREGAASTAPLPTRMRGVSHGRRPVIQTQQPTKTHARDAGGSRHPPSLIVKSPLAVGDCRRQRRPCRPCSVECISHQSGFVKKRRLVTFIM